LVLGHHRTRFLIPVRSSHSCSACDVILFIFEASPEVQAWLKELEGRDIPDFSPTADGSCVGDPAAAADAAKRGWWTCGGHTRDTGTLTMLYFHHQRSLHPLFSLPDITACPDKLTWGVRCVIYF